MSGGTFLVGIVAVVAALAGRALAARSGVPYAVFLVVFGAGASFVPGVPAVRMDPTVVFSVILPPLVYHAGFLSSPREARENAASIALSAFGLVLATTFAVAAVTHLAVPSFGWAPAVVLGAAVAPTDPVSATTVLARVGAPRRITTILEGEGLVNDGIALTLLSVGIASVGAPTGVTTALLDFLKVAAGGIAFGVATGFVLARARRIGHDTTAVLLLSLATPYLAYVGADRLGLSGILSAVSAGVVVGQTRGAYRAPRLRLVAESFWETATFLLESWLFVLVGLQFRSVVTGAESFELHVVLELGAAVVGAVVVVRMAWELLIPSLRWRPAEGERRLDTGTLGRGERFVLGWAGLRGAISLAAVLSVPTAVAGRPFPERELILLATFCVIAFTLVGQGSLLGPVIRLAHVGTSEAERTQSLRARRAGLEAALRRLEEIAGSGKVAEDVVSILNQVYERRLERANAGLDHDDADDEGSISIGEVQTEMIRAQRQALRDMYREGEIDYAVLRESLHDLDLEQESARRR